ncbi:hypothetical protein MKX03_016111 [Papaver bracteatum]|nr:hypothetical protein MKX03_016111 [Papaver bracteatum]
MQTTFFFPLFDYVSIEKRKRNAISMVNPDFLITLRELPGVAAFNQEELSFLSSSRMPEDLKWEKISYAGIASCTTFAVWTLSKGHPHAEEQLAYPCMHIRNKEFPWGKSHDIC